MTVTYPNAVRGDVRPRLPGKIDPRLKMPDRYALAVLADSPNAYYRCHDLATSTTAVDSSGNGRNGTYLASTLRQSPGPLSYGNDIGINYGFSPGGSQAAVAAQAGFTVTTQTYATDFTIECWLWLPGTSQDFHNGLCGARTGTGVPYISFQNADHLQFYSGSAWIGTQTAAITALTWHHFACTRTSGTVAYYLDGASTGATGSNSTSVGIDIIGSGMSDSRGWCGLLSEFALYTSGLSSGRIAAHYAAR